MESSLRPAVYWFWDHLLTPEEAERQAREIAAAGFGEVMIQARLSLPRADYLSDAYLRAYRTAAVAAIRAGLEVSVYDDYNWASGQAGGRTVAGLDGDHLRERHLFWATAPPGARAASISGITSPWFDGLGPPGVGWIYEDGVRRFDEWSLVAAVAASPAVAPAAVAAPADAADPPHDVSAWARIAGGPDGCVITLDDDAPVPDGWNVHVYVSARCASSRLIDYLEPAAARRFLEVTHERYAAALDGVPVRAYSFDHPYSGFYTWAQRDGTIGNSLMWHPALPASGVELHAIVHDLGPRGRQARARFFAAYAARGIASFLAPLADWTRAHGVGLTGHELLAHVGGFGLTDGFPELDSRTNFGADHFAIDRHRTATLVDAVGSAPQLSPRFGDSVARASRPGPGGCTVELYYARHDPPEEFAAGEWELTLPQLRIAALRLHLLGAARFLFHAYHATDGRDDDPRLLVNPRFDFPPAINFEPWFPWFGALARESSRLAEFLAPAEPIRDVALVYPLATVWADGPGHPHGAILGAWAECLARAGIGFDIVDDRALDTAEVRDGRAWPTPGTRGYAAVVVPGAATVPTPRSVAVLESLAAAGGTVIAAAPLPDLSVSNGPDPGLGSRLAEVSARPVGATPAEALSALSLVDSGSIGTLDAGPGTVWRWSGIVDGVIRVALLNDGPASRTVRLPGADGSAELELELVLESGELACVTLQSGEPSEAGGPAQPGVTRVPVSPAFPPAPRPGAPAQVLTHGWTLEPAGPPPLGATSSAWPVDPTRGWERQGLETFAGIATYRCRFDLDAPDFDPSTAWTLELPAVDCAARAALNGVVLGERGWPPYRFAIPSGTLRVAANELAIDIANAGANRYYAGTPFAIAPLPSGLGAAPRLTR